MRTMDKTKIYLDLSKCTEEQVQILNKVTNGYINQISDKIELTYPEFIKLFAGGDVEIDIEKLAKESLKFQHKNIQDRMIDFVLGFEEGFKKAMELNSNQ